MSGHWQATPIPTRTPKPTRTSTNTSTPTNTKTPTPTLPVTQPFTLTPSYTPTSITCYPLLGTQQSQTFVSFYRAPIDGNPNETDNEGNPTITNTSIVDGYAIDPLINVLWFHIAPNSVYSAPSPDDFWAGWVEITSSTQKDYTVTIHQHEIVVPRKSFTLIPSIRGFVLTQEQIQNCINAGIPDESFAYTLPALNDVPWTNTIPLFNWMPLSGAQMCQYTSLHATNLRSEAFALYDLSLYGNNYLPKGYHNGVDIYASEYSSVYSMSGSGLVVGIGRGQPTVRYYIDNSSGGGWGAAYVNDKDHIGYNVIVRYGSLYVLYGHLIRLDPHIYVGRKVDMGDRLGAIGQVDTPHLHFEVRNLGSSITRPDKTLVFVSSIPSQVPTTYDQPNKYGILKLGASQGDINEYDVMQLFQPSVQSYGQDLDSGSSKLNISGLGISLRPVVNPPKDTMSSSIQIGDTCSLFYHTILGPESSLIPTVPAGANPGFRGFILGNAAFSAPIDPNTQIMPPSVYPQ